MIFFTRKFQVLVVCTENLCRSPVAEGLLREHLRSLGLAKSVRVESAGTHASRLGSRADQRAIKVAASAGLDITRSRVRRISAADFTRYDLLLAVDDKNFSALVQRCPDTSRDKVRRMMEVLPEHELSEVPDPYYGSVDGFRKVHDLLDQATLAWAYRIQGALPT